MSQIILVIANERIFELSLFLLSRLFILDTPRLIVEPKYYE